MTIPTIQRAARAPHHAQANTCGALILLYHRVVEIPSDPQSLCVTPRHFAEHLEVIKQWGRPSGLRTLVAHLQQHSLPPKSIVVTFDDGYADNVHHAKPLLESADVPAVVFVTTDYLDGQREFWWDELENLLLTPGSLPNRLSLRLNRSEQRWDITDAATYSRASAAKHQGWTVLEQDHPTVRHRLYRDLFDLLRLLPPSSRRDTLDFLWQWANQPRAVRSTHRALTTGEVTELAAGGLVEIGAHTLTHPVLSSLPPADQRVEIEGSKVRLEEILGHPVSSFSYPFGTRRDYTESTVDLVKEAGFNDACSNQAGVAQPGVDRYRLPRLLVRNWEGETFQRRLQEAFCAT